MVVFNSEGLQKLKDIALGALSIRLVGDVANSHDELSIILTKISYVMNNNMSGLLVMADGSYILGATTPTVDVDVGNLFAFFGISHVTATIPDAALNSRNNGFVYSTTLGEAMLKNDILGAYLLNDGSRIDVSKFPNNEIIPLKKEYFQEYMPDLASEHKKAEKVYQETVESLGLSGLKEGSKIRIRHYDDLAKQYGESILVIGDDDMAVLVDHSDDPEAVHFIRHLGYGDLSAKYYNGKVGTIVSIDITTGNLTIDIDGNTKHSFFIDENGNEQSNSDEDVIFSLEMIELV